MYIAVDRPGVQRLAEQGARLVEVLPASAFEEQHLPGAVNLPLARLDAQAALRLRVVLGSLPVGDHPRPGQPAVADVMEPGPMTARPHLPPPRCRRPLAGKTRSVTTSEGVLIGLVRCADLERSLRATGGTRAA